MNDLVEDFIYGCADISHFGEGKLLKSLGDLMDSTMKLCKDGAIPKG
jgi:hypothetical protein